MNLERALLPYYNLYYYIWQIIPWSIDSLAEYMCSSKSVAVVFIWKFVWNCSSFPRVYIMWVFPIIFLLGVCYSIGFSCNVSRLSCFIFQSDLIQSMSVLKVWFDNLCCYCYFNWEHMSKDTCGGQRTTLWVFSTPLHASRGLSSGQQACAVRQQETLPPEPSHQPNRCLVTRRFILLILILL